MSLQMNKGRVVFTRGEGGAARCIQCVVPGCEAMINTTNIKDGLSVGLPYTIRCNAHVDIVMRSNTTDYLKKLAKAGDVTNTEGVVNDAFTILAAAGSHRISNDLAHKMWSMVHPDTKNNLTVALVTSEIESVVSAAATAVESAASQMKSLKAEIIAAKATVESQLAEFESGKQRHETAKYNFETAIADGKWDNVTAFVSDYKIADDDMKATNDKLTEAIMAVNESDDKLAKVREVLNKRITCADRNIVRKIRALKAETVHALKGRQAMLAHRATLESI